MRYLFLVALIIVCFGSANAFDLGSIQKDTKSNSHVGLNPGTPDGREGGEDMGSAYPITSLPFSDSGNTFDNVNDYDAVCPYSGSTAPDVVYSYTPATDVVVSVDFCGSGYDTKAYIMDGAFNLIACNDDFYSDAECGVYVSLIEGAELAAGTEYFIIVDGYGADAGDYIMVIEEFTPEPPCVLTCDGVVEGEPALGPGYADFFNGGCNSPEFGAPWGDLTTSADANGDMTFCGIAGWTDSGRDTDWNYLMIGMCGMVVVSVDAEQLTTVHTLTMTSCDDVAVDQSMTVGVCAPGLMTVQGNPGDVFMMWFGASEYTPPAGFVGYEYDYVVTFAGLNPGSLNISPTFGPTTSVVSDIGCATTSPVTFRLYPGCSTDPIRGYSVRIVGDSNFSFSEDDVTIFSVPSGESEYHQIIENGQNDLTIDYALLGPDTPGIVFAENLFSINLHGENEDFGEIQVIQADFRGLNNVSQYVDYGAVAQVYVDCSGPMSVTGISAVPGHQKTTLSWEDPTDDDFAGVLVYRANWSDGNGNSAYPLYGNHSGSLIPVRPEDSAAAEASSQWELAGDISGGVQSFVDDVVDRGIQFYEFFSRDDFNNDGPPAPNFVLATNYWLGDLDPAYDGQITISDLSVLGAAYGTNTGDLLFNDEADVGPTENASSIGLPQPDGEIGFDDLMIVALNFGEVTPDKLEDGDSGRVLLSWEQVSATEWVLSLDVAHRSFKGLHLSGNISEGASFNYVPGSLLSDQQGPVFLRNAGHDGLEIDLAILGRDLAFSGQGELFRVVMDEGGVLSDIQLEVRGTSNQILGTEFDSSFGESLPARHQLRQNFPNPFNPSTTISFDLPEGNMVRVAIYSLDGRLVKTIVEDNFSAGSHDVVWKGMDDSGRRVASGTYFCRMVSGDFDRIMKMVLTK